MSRECWAVLGVALIVAGAASVCAQPAPSYLNFESGPVRPLALSSDGSRLYAVNTPDQRLEVLAVRPDGLVPLHSVPVGIDPVAVALRNDGEAWVVNHLSDSISVVDLTGRPRVVRTLLVGDEPRDIVFAGPEGRRAFITTAHRGQYRQRSDLSDVPGAGDPQFTTPGVGRADVWVFDADDLDGGGAAASVMGGKPVRIVQLFGDTPRALAVTPDGSAVYAAVLHSGNQTTVVQSALVCNGPLHAGCAGDGHESPGGLPDGRLPPTPLGPGANAAGHPAPHVGILVQFDNEAGEWQDELGRNWTNGVRFRLPDLDVFRIDASTLAVDGAFAHVGTTLFNMAVNPINGDVYVTNTDANNMQRFVGAGNHAGTTLQGHLAESRVTILRDNQVLPRALNSHIDYSISPAPTWAAEHSLATPTGIAVAADGRTLFVAAFGSGRIGVIDVAELAGGGFDPRVASADYLELSGGGPSGLVLDHDRQRLFAATRFDNSVSMIDLRRGVEVAHQALPTPEPAAIISGRPLLYDAVATSSNGEASCAACHVFGDADALAWDLGEPDGSIIDSPLPINMLIVATTLGQASPDINGSGVVTDLHPMKGPMLTQTLRGIRHSGAMHWRGDRAVGPAGTAVRDPYVSFGNFRESFVDLLGRDGALPLAWMDQLAEFALSIVPPPNPNRRLNNRLTSRQARGRAFFMGPRRALGTPIDLLPGDPQGFTCEGCHTLEPENGHFGADGSAAFEFLDQIFKIPPLRQVYQKVGMFGMPSVPIANVFDNGYKGDQIRGYGLLHNGSTDTIYRHLNATVFNRNETILGQTGFPDDATRLAMEQYILAFDSDLAPIVGAQITWQADAAAAATRRVKLLRQRALTPFVSRILGGAVTEGELVATGVVNGEPRGWWLQPDRTFAPDRRADRPLRLAQLLAAAGDAELTFTVTPPGAGRRVGIDRDGDGVLNGDDRCPAVVDAQIDVDQDGFGDACDNCPLDFDPTQRDTNGDGLGNICDADLNNDGQVDAADHRILTALLFQPHAGDADLDGNGWVDAADLWIMFQLWGQGG